MLNKLIVVLVLLLMFSFLLLSETYSAINSDFTPQWKVGDSWEVVYREMLGAIVGRQEENETESPGPATFINFEVIGISDMNGETCYVVEITYKNPTSDIDSKVGVWLYIRKSDFTLKQIAKLTRDSLNSPWETRDFYNNKSDFVMFDMPFNVSIPCDFPNFSESNVNEEKTIKTPVGLIVTQKLTFLTEITLQVELTTNDGTGTIKTTQIWERGKLWWSSCKREFTYKDYETGEMKTRIESNHLLVGKDTIPPVLQLSVTPTTIWPPNHEMVEIKPTISVSDDYDIYPDVKLESITSNEPDDATGEGDGHTTQDIQAAKVWDNKEREMIDNIFLRAERDGKGNGRIYSITYSATDFSGNKISATSFVTVPHDQGKK